MGIELFWARLYGLSDRSGFGGTQLLTASTRNNLFDGIRRGILECDGSLEKSSKEVRDRDCLVVFCKQCKDGKCCSWGWEILIVATEECGRSARGFGFEWAGCPQLRRTVGIRSGLGRYDCLFERRLRRVNTARWSTMKQEVGCAVLIAIVTVIVRL